MFLLASEASFDGFDDRQLTSAHAGLMAVIDRYVEDRLGQSVANGARTIRPRLF